MDVEVIDDEAIDDLIELEKQMYREGDARHGVLRRALDVLSTHGVIDDTYYPPKKELS